MYQREVLIENVIEKNIKDWFQKNPGILIAVRGDREMSNKNSVGKRFLLFMNEAPKYKAYLRQIGIIEDGLTNTGYIYLRRIAESIPVSSIKK